MEISSRFVGSPLKPLDARITWRQTTNYAAALDDANPRYLDDSDPGGLVAPPMFAVAVTWPISERIPDFIETSDFPFEILATQVHYTEHLEFFRLIRPDDRLTVQGRVAAILPHKAGTLMVLRYDARDEAGAPVFTEHIGGMMRGVRCTDDGAGAETLPETLPQPEPGDPLWETRIRIERTAPFVYDGCTNIHFPIHTSVKFAREVGLPDIIYQGTATLALGVRDVIKREAGGDPERVRSIACRFTGMVIPGSEIRVRLLESRSDGDRTHLFFSILNTEGKRAVSDGVVTLLR
ncbi:MAG: MaoC family dehydratase N-terminal domain-containing protein [Syntrophales bacterium]|jgi:acyl dehydratase|nr:MaoC family dehydratase N-terminal domain-containing protein [Syntrophales bacterium]MDD4338383.1 MaoC/PaaZ C-terminal domain-containing protein [Syntrophales bacterium]HOG06811.1 MaoC/PaaZ C-terminal domain-containing protein [Syntrophales bacterium]HOS77154.1 MaoC/PaaZ C-terminal domain-containing protein [Syntrophales bacterium]HPB70189.1 MaoC/PaaZ C-terminal domain-containing protein [Syntrophales bacterium]